MSALGGSRAILVNWTKRAIWAGHHISFRCRISRAGQFLVVHGIVSSCAHLLGRATVIVTQAAYITECFMVRWSIAMTTIPRLAISSSHTVRIKETAFFSLIRTRWLQGCNKQHIAASSLLSSDTIAMVLAEYCGILYCHSENLKWKEVAGRHWYPSSGFHCEAMRLVTPAQLQPCIADAWWCPLTSRPNYWVVGPCLTDRTEAQEETVPAHFHLQRRRAPIWNGMEKEPQLWKWVCRVQAKLWYLGRALHKEPDLDWIITTHRAIPIGKLEVYPIFALFSFSTCDRGFYQHPLIRWRRQCQPNRRSLETAYKWLLEPPPGPTGSEVLSTWNLTQSIDWQNG